MNGDGDSLDTGEAKWVVVLEAATRIDDSSLHRLLEVLADVHAVALHCSDRYAVQMQIAAGGQAEALFVALGRWRSALAAVGQPLTEVVRAEVLCPEEFERDCRLAYSGALPSDADEASDRRLRLLSSWAGAARKATGQSG